MSAFSNPLLNSNGSGKPFGLDKSQVGGNKSNGIYGSIGNKGNFKKKTFIKNTKQNYRDKPRRKPNTERRQGNIIDNGMGDHTGIEMQVEDFNEVEMKVIPKSAINYQKYPTNQVNIVGPIINNPEQFGFHKKKLIPREVPKYLQIETRIIEPIAFKQDSWDKENQDKMNLMEQQSNGNDYQGLYEEFQKMREVERKKMEELGLVDAENIRKDLNDAISFQGTCLDMCPTFERVRRALENNVKQFEKDPITNKIDKSRAVKAFSRPAAGQPPPLPAEVRPPFVLVRSLNYLIDNIVSKLPESHSFLWDRTRSIRQDFTYQNYFGPEAIECNEKIVRIHLISLHIMSGSDVEYSQQQELEQFNKALQTLIEIYQDVRNRGGYCPNEAEFRSYYLISHLRDNEVERELQSLPNLILKHPLIKLSLKFRSLMAQNNIVERGYKNTVGCLNLYVELFRLIYSDETPFLLACLLETQFNEIRFYALKAMTRAYHTKDKAYDGKVLALQLGFSRPEELMKFVQYYEVDIIHEKGTFLVDLVNKEKLESQYKLNSISDKPKLSQLFSPQLDIKINKPLAAFINCGESNDNLHLRKSSVDERFESANDQDVKSGSFADFLSKSQPFKDFKDVTPSNFASTTLAPTIINNQQENNKPHSIPPQKKIEEIKEPSQPSQSTFNFGESGGDKKVKGSFNQIIENPLNLPSLNITNVQKQSSFSVKAQEPKLDGVKVIADPITKLPELTDSVKFHQANEQITLTLISQIVNEHLYKIIPKLINKENSKRQKHKIIDIFSKELYQAFLNEVVYQTVKDIQADYVYSTNLKRKYIRKLHILGDTLKTKHRLQRKREAELDDTKFGNKRFNANTSVSSINSSKKREAWNETSIDEVVIRRNEIAKLWSPLNLGLFLELCSTKPYLSIDPLKMKFLVIVEDWNVNYSKWLRNKLDLILHESKTTYIKDIETPKMKMTFTSLPPRENLNKDFFRNTGFVLFECGLLQNLDRFPSVDKKLQRDGLILQRILQLVNKFCDYTVQLLIVYWDLSGGKLNHDEIQQFLNVATDDVVTSIVICDMSRDDCNINDILREGFSSLTSEFTGKLSPRGLKKQKFLVPPKEVNKVINNDEFKAKEDRLKRKAKWVNKYAYLNNHSFNKTMMNSFNNTTMNSFNKTIHTNNSTILEPNLSGFGKGIIEESTPSSTPISSPRKIMKANRNIQELIDLTTRIRSKYK